MTQPGYTHYILLIDRTGSMASIKSDTEGGIAHFVKEQRELGGHATMSFYEFDAWEPEVGMQMTTQINQITDFRPLDGVPDYVLNPRGNTPLLDATGKVVTREGAKLASMPEHERPDQVIVVIATDGAENWSDKVFPVSEWIAPGKVAELITQQQRDYAWKFVYIGANQDAWATARSMGIPVASSLDYAATPAGTRAAWSSTSGAVATAVAGNVDIGYTEEEREAAKNS